MLKTCRVVVLGAVVFCTGAGWAQAGTPGSASGPTSMPTLVEPTAPPLKQYDGPTYYRIPLTGFVGATFSDRLLQTGLQDAEKRKPTVVVLEFDSPGGLISEVDKMVRTLAGYQQKMRIVAHVRQAISAAAITSLAVREIYMSRSAVLGAATAYQTDASGVPKDIDEKMKAIWLASARAAAEVGDHSSVLAEAMIDRQVPLWREPNAKAQDSYSKEAGIGRVQVKEPGKLLAVTAREAVQTGLATGIAEDMTELSTKLGPGKWQECEGLATPLAKFSSERLIAAQREFQPIAERFAAALVTAAKEHPNRYNDYAPLGNPGYAQSLGRWRARAQQCSRSISKADLEMRRIEALAQKYPELGFSLDGISAERRALKLMQEELATGQPTVKK